MGLILAGLGVAVLGGVLYRCRGGALRRWLPGGTFVSRMVWWVPTGVLCGVLTNSWEVGLACAFTAYLGSILPHAWAQNGDTLGTIGMGAVCAIRGALIAVPPFLLLGLVWSLVPIFGGLAGVAYLIGWHIPSKIPELEQGTPIGEVLVGVLIWVAIFLSGVFA